MSESQPLKAWKKNAKADKKGYQAVSRDESAADDEAAERGEAGLNKNGNSNNNNGHGHSHGKSNGSNGSQHHRAGSLTIDDALANATHHHSSHSHEGSHSSPSSSLLSSSKARLSPRSAFLLGDVEASRQAHAEKRKQSEKSKPEDMKEVGHANTDTGDYIKSIVYGGLDGIITTFATVTSVAGAEFSAAVVVVLGISHLFADGVSMGMGDYMSSQAELDFVASERAREEWEWQNSPQGEIEEMIDLYKAKGFTETDARIVINTMAKYPDAFLDHMMVEELGLLPSKDQGFSPKKAGMVTMASFMTFGAIPLLPYIIALFPGITLNPAMQLMIAVVGTVITLFLLGAFKAHQVDARKGSWWRSGLLMAVNGSVAAAIGFFCGYSISMFMDLPKGAA